jgi:hypothetical protein
MGTYPAPLVLARNTVYVIAAVPGLALQDTVTALLLVATAPRPVGALVLVVTLLCTEFPDTPPAVVAVTT